jgi:hypothetical protein
VLVFLAGRQTRSSMGAGEGESGGPSGAAEGKVKLTKKEKEQRERELRRSLPPLSQVGRNGVFEMIGPLSYTWAAGNVPGGPFVPVSVIARGHNLYIFDSSNAPSAKPRAFFQIKRADVEKIGLLVIPPLPPHNHVFRLTFAKKQFGNRAFFFKATSGKEMERWLTDLRWRVLASENEIKRNNEPIRTRKVVLRCTDETETAVERAPQRVLGCAVRYDERPPKADVEDDL